MTWHQAGYSLVELTIVVGLVAILSVAISSVVLMSVVQSTRVRNQIRTRQAGDYAVTQIQTMLRSSRSVLSCDSGSNSITIQNPDGNLTTFAVELDSGASRIASNSGLFLTPDDVTTSGTFDLECFPDDTEVKLVNLDFTLSRVTTSERPHENPPIHFQTSIELRNN